MDAFKLAAGKVLGGDLAGKRGRPAGEGIEIGGNIHSGALVFFDILDNLGRLAFIMVADDLYMGDIDRDSAGPSDDKSLFDRFLKLVALAADMGGVYTAILIGDLCDLDKLVRAGKNRRRIYKAGGKTETAAFHGLGHQAAVHWVCLRQAP